CTFPISPLLLFTTCPSFSPFIKKSCCPNAVYRSFLRRLIMLRNKRDVKQLESQLNQIHKHIHTMTEDHFNQSIKDFWQQLKIHIAEENLKKMPVDTISTLEKGMPINVLVNNGYRTLYDIKDQTIADSSKLMVLVKLALSQFLIPYQK